MKNITIKLLFLAIFLFSTSVAFSQDRLYFINGNVMEVKIESVGDRELVYFKSENGQEVRHVIQTRQLIRIVRADGSTEIFEVAYKDPSLYTGQLKRSLKFHLFSPLLGHTGFSYEQSLSPGKGLEVTAGFIGLGNNFELGYIYDDVTFIGRDINVDPLGGYVGVGYKFYSKPVVRSTGWRYRHLLQGWYVMPKFLAGHYKENTIVRDGNFFGNERVDRRSVTFLGVMAYAGKQVIFAGTYLLEWHIGLGIGGHNIDESNSNHYVITMGSNNAMIGGGLRLGILF